MIFAFDYDGCFAAAPDLFRELAGVVARHGHLPVMVTLRSPTGRLGDEVRAAVGDAMPIVFTDGEPKPAAAAEAGYIPDVWIDDQPEHIGKRFRRRRRPRRGDAEDRAR